MKELSNAVDVFRKNSFITMPQVISAELAGAILERLKRSPHPTPAEKVIKEKNGAIRSVYYELGDDAAIDAVARLTDLVKVAETILESSVYIYQIKLNVKAAGVGDRWAWHQDYIFWKEGDGMPSSSVLSAALLLEDATALNGPLKIIPRGDRGELLPQDCYESKKRNGNDYQKDLAADLSYTLKGAVVDKLISEHGVNTMEGTAGDAVLFSGTAVHSSELNRSTRDRHMLLVTYNSTKNIRENPIYTRPTFLANRDNSPVLKTGCSSLKAALNVSPDTSCADRP